MNCWPYIWPAAMPPMPQALKRRLANLVENAVQYGKHAMVLIEGELEQV